MYRSLSRRKFLQTSALAGSGLVLTSNVSSQSLIPIPLRVRRSALSLPADDPVFTKYAEAVTKMHELPATDPRNWMNQAKIHADRCPHGTNGFLPWHRYYITYFEEICGQLIGDKSFALPYWDWTAQRGIIPDPFFDVQELNVVYWKDSGSYTTPPSGWGTIDTIPIRAIGKSVGVQDDPVRGGGAFTSRNINSILGESQFDVFYRRLEGSPHNTGHVVVGFPAQGKRGHIGEGLSPLDPLFWLHHCNVDRIWAQWQLARNKTPDIELDYDGHFVDASGTKVRVAANGARDFAALGFTYDSIGDPKQVVSLAGIVDSAAPNNAPVLESLKDVNLSPSADVIGQWTTSETVKVGIETKLSVSVTNLKSELNRDRSLLQFDLPNLKTIEPQNLNAEMFSDFGKATKQPRRILAHFKGVVGAFERNPLVNVFVNCPYLNPETGADNIHYAGTFSFFGSTKHDEHNGGGEFYVDLTHVLNGLDVSSLESIDVQLMAVPGSAGGAMEGSFMIESVDILSV